MIEFLTPRAGAFAESEQAEFVGLDNQGIAFDDHEPHPRWPAALATLAVSALLVAGVAAAAPWDGPDRAPAPRALVRPTPTTVAMTAAATVGTPSTIERTEPRGPSGWLLDGELGFELADLGSDADPTSHGGDRLDLWVSGDVSRTSGRWVAIDVQWSVPGYESIRPEATIVDINGANALAWTAPDGVVELHLASTSDAPYIITSFGLELAALIEIATSITIDDRTIDYGSLLDDPRGPLSGLKWILADEVPLSGLASTYGAPQAWSSYANRSGESWLEITLTEPDPLADMVYELLLGRALTDLEFGPDGASSIDHLRSDTRRFEIRAAPTDSRQLTARFQSNGQQLTVKTRGVDVAGLAYIVFNLRPASPDEWTDLLAQASDGFAIATAQTNGPTEVSDRSSSQANLWSAIIGPGYLAIYGQDVTSTWSFHPVGEPSIATYRSRSHGFVLATTGSDQHQRIRVTTDDGEQTIATLRRVASTAPLFAIVVEVDPAETFTVEWIE